MGWHRGMARGWAVVVLVATVFAGLLPAYASTPEADQGQEDTPLVREGQFQAPKAAAQNQVSTANFWTIGNDAFFLTDGTAEGYRTIVKLDLRTGSELQRSALPARTYLRPTKPPENHVAVDLENRRLFIPVGPALANDASGTVQENTNLVFQPSQGAKVERLWPYVGAAQRGQACLDTYICFTSVWMMDAVTLQPLKEFVMPLLRVEGPPLAPALLAMNYAPSRGPGDAAKLLVLTRDERVPADPRTSTNTVRLIQFDVERGTVDWSYRVEACRSPRDSPNEQVNQNLSARPGAGAVFRDPDPASPYVYVGCHSGGSSQSGTVVRIPLDEAGNPPGAPVTASQPEDVEPGTPAAPVRPSLQPDVFVGPERTFEVWADPVSGRIVFNVADGEPVAQVLWVFDASGWRMLGTVGIGRIVKETGLTISGLDAVRGRFYVLIAPVQRAAGGLYLVDVRRTPLAQALVFPEFKDLGIEGSAIGDNGNSIITAPHMEGGPRFYIPTKPNQANVAWTEVRDRVPVGSEAVVEVQRRSLDLEEREGVTDAAVDGAARGYGARLLLIGGVDAATRVGPVDALGNVLQFSSVPLTDSAAKAVFSRTPWEMAGSPRLTCATVNRDVVLGFVGPRGSSVVDGSGSRGEAQAVVVDSSTQADGEAPVSRCGSVVDAFQDWESLWAGALFGRPPVAEPRSPGALQPADSVQCVSSDRREQASGDPVTATSAAAVACEDDTASGYAYTRGLAVGPVNVGEALSSFRIYRDPGRGIVSRVESVTRGFEVPGVLRISTVRGVAESWANGRSQPVGAQERPEGYEANCDLERTAGTCFRRHVFGVWTPGYACGPCGDEATMVQRVNRGMGAYGSVRLREPDPGLAQGSADGFTAAIQKPDADRFADLVLNNDLLQTVVPTLEIVRQAPPNRTLAQGGQRGRQIIQLAGVEVSSSYAIQCLLVYDEATNTCAEAAEPPGSITVSLADADGKPLAGGAFEVRQDVDADGVLGLADTLLPNGACVTADDGIGTCKFDSLKPGPYLVGQVAAPPGYGKSAEPFVVELGSGEARTVAFTNASNLSAVELKAVDENGGPLTGAVFAAFPDPDSDGKVAPEAKPAAECTTDGQGVCRMQVPAGSYVLVQTSAPAGLEGIEPVPFTFASGGQVAAVNVTNYPPDTPQAPSAPAPHVPVYTPPVDQAPPVQIVDDYTPADSEVVPPETAPGDSVVDQVGGTVVKVIRAPGDALRLLSRDPKQAVAWTAALALFCLAAMAVRRRQHATSLMHH